MWQELLAAVGGLLLVLLPVLQGYANQTLLLLLNLAIAVHVLYLSLSAFAISRIESRTWRRYPGRRWLMVVAALVAAPAVALPPLLGLGTDLVASRNNLFCGALIFFCSLWAALLPPPARGEAEEAAEEAPSRRRSPRAGAELTAGA
ncbi:MAG: hypothetical protein IRZ11_01110 [Clostridia bacterium]|nr:hypothetical protein [Clostridia bacterium]